MSGILLTQSSTPVIGEVAVVLGWIMDKMFVLLDTLFGIQNIGLSIILFTIVIYTLMLPLTIRQQKFMKLTSVMQPEIKKIQDKYKGKKDNASMQKQQEEMKDVYAKYGTSQTGGCLQMLIQMPILFGLYQVIRNIPAYVPSVKEAYTDLVNGIMATDGYQGVMEALGSESPIAVDPEKYDYSQANTLVDVLYKFQTSTWETLHELFPELESVIDSTMLSIEHLNSFLGINIANSPMAIIKDNLNGDWSLVIVAGLIPILAALAQFASIKLSSSSQPVDKDNQIASSMNSVNTTMPIMSLVFCFTLPAGLGLYWIASAVVRIVQQILITKYFNRIPVEELVQKNQEKAAKKREKKGVSAQKLNEMAQTNAKKIEDSKSKLSDAEKKEKLEKAAQNKSNAKQGSLAARANMVKDYNENNKK